MVLDNFSWQSACSVVFVSGGASVATDRRWPRNDGRADLRATDPRDLRATRRRTAPQAATVPEIGSTRTICVMEKMDLDVVIICQVTIICK